MNIRNTSPLIFVKAADYGFSLAQNHPMQINYSLKIDDPCYTPLNPLEPEPAGEADEEGNPSPITGEFSTQDWNFIMLGSFDSFNDYSYVKMLHEDVFDSGSAHTDKASFNIQASKPVTIFLVYFCNEADIPPEVRVWHVVERWSTDSRLKPPVIRNMLGFQKGEEGCDLTGCLIKKKEFPAGDIKIKTSQGAHMCMFLKPVPARSKEEDDADPAKSELLTRPWLFGKGPEIRSLLKTLRLEFGDVDARAHLLRKETTAGFQKSGEWISNLYM